MALDLADRQDRQPCRQLGSSTMAAYIARRLLIAFFTIAMISVLAFFVVELPEGDQATKRFDRTRAVSSSELQAQEMVDVLRRYLNLDRPIYVRYGLWIWNLLQGDLGIAFGPTGNGLLYQKTVKSIIGDRLWITIALTGFTIMVTWTFAIPVGIYSAVRQHSVGDYAFTLLGFSGLAVPDFLLGLVLMYLAYAYFDQSVGGLFSADYANAPWSLAQGKRFHPAPVDPSGRPGHLGDGQPDPHNAEQPAGRAEQALRSDREGQGPLAGEDRPEVPGTGGHQSANQHNRVSPAVAR